MKDVTEWLDKLGLSRLSEAFVANGIDFGLIHELTNDDLKDLGIDRLADRKKLLKEIERLALEKAHTSVERRLLSVLFCDLVGSTALSRKVDPEELRNAVRLYHDTTVRSITKFGGFIASLMGDGVLAYFGWPYAKEDQAAQAVRAGLETVATVKKLEFENGVILHCRVGIATGRVVVGGDSHLDSAFGETPNLAARLQTFAAEDQVVIDRATQHAIGQGFESKELGGIELKGFGHAVAIWEVSEERHYVDRFDTRSAGGSKFVGRDGDLQKMFGLWDSVVSKKGQTVVIHGEAGIGKSRLVKEFAKAIQSKSATVIRYQCSPHHTNSAFYPVIRHIEKAAGFDPHDEPVATKRAKVAELFQSTLGEDPGALDIIADMLSISEIDSGKVLQLSATKR